LTHAPQRPVSAAEVALLLAGGLVVGLVLTRALRAQVATWRAVAELRRLAGGQGGVVETSEPLSITAGLLWPLVLVSTGLRTRLTPAQLGAVLAHERAHARRRDPLRLLVVSLLGAVHGPRTRRRLLADMALACEEAADEAAAVEVGDRTLVAEAILAVERLLWDRSPRAGLALGMAGCATEARVESLLQAPLPERPARAGRAALWAAGAIAAVAAAAEIHHLTETVLDLIAR
ncbi:MAG: M48 family metalloprotease, partial [Anaeromyxobacteraceae bacterium]|nr:M48 family metalloprotease [Anaeromyxobacteraceae bacterium]